MTLVLQSFSFEKIELIFFSFVHPVTGEVWFEGNAIAKCLGYSNYNKAIRVHVQNPLFKCVWNELIQGLPTVGGPLPVPSNWQSKTTMINEGGLNSLILASKLPNAQKYKDWVCGTVLPSIRKTGKYEMPTTRTTTTSVIPFEQQILKLENEKKDLQIQLLEKDLKIKDLTMQANATLTEFGVMGLMAQRSAQQNDEMRTRMDKIKDRVVPVVEGKPEIDTFVACYTNPTNNCIDVRRNQRRTMEMRDKILQQYIENPTKRLKSSEQEQRYGWLRGAEKVIDVKCANAVALWNKIKTSYPEFVYGFRFLNSARTKIRFLSEDELREKYSVDRKARDEKDFKTMTTGFEELQFVDEDDAVRRCLTPDREIKEKMKKIIQNVVDDLNRETSTGCGAETRTFSPQDVFNFIMNHTWNSQTNIVNINNYSSPITGSSIEAAAAVIDSQKNLI